MPERASARAGEGATVARRPVSGHGRMNTFWCWTASRLVWGRVAPLGETELEAEWDFHKQCSSRRRQRRYVTLRGELFILCYEW